jgi:PAS domain S-box-containing protein
MMTENLSNKIMVVEDEVLIALRLQKRLTEMGYDVPDVVYSGEEAVEKARSFRPDLILMDIMIPGNIDGITVAEIVKSELDIPVIFLTAFSEDNIIERAKKIEPFGYILKPFQDRELKAAIEVAFYKKEMEKALKKSEERYRALAENTGVGFWQTTLDGHTIYINPAMCEILEIDDPEEIHGKTYHSFYSAENQKIIKRELVKRKKGISSTYEVEILGKKGGRRNVMVSGAPIFLSEDKIDSAIGTFTDITDKKRAEEELRKAHDELEHRVNERTFELHNALETVMRNEKELSQGKSSLEKLNKELMETNQAVSVLARNIDKKKEALENKIFRICNIKLMPILKELQKDVYCQKRKADLELIINYLNEITHDSPLYHDILTHLTYQEMRVAMMIKNGLTSQQIGDLLFISLHTVKTHRKNMRKKLNIENTDINLASYLKSKIKTQD